MPKKKPEANPRTPKKSYTPEDPEITAFMESISHPKINRPFLRKYRDVYRRLEKVLAAASPKSKADLISGIAVDLADFWEIAVEHQRRIKQLTKLRYPRDRQQFIALLYEFEIRLLGMRIGMLSI
jgi:hypothetical protein